MGSGEARATGCARSGDGTVTSRWHRRLRLRDSGRTRGTAVAAASIPFPRRR